MLSFDELVRVGAVVGFAISSGVLVWVGAVLAARTPRRGETAAAAAARLDEVMPYAADRASARKPEVIQAELLRLQEEMTVTRQALAERPSGPTVVVVEARGVLDTDSTPAEVLSVSDDPPALPERPRGDRGNASIGFLLFFVIGLLIFGYVREHGVAESVETWNRCGQSGMRALTKSDVDALNGCTDDSDGKGPRPSRVWGSTSTAELRAALARVEVVEERCPDAECPGGYSREEFGPDWTDEYEGPGGGNDCDTRNDVLADQMRHVRREDGCVVASGTLADPYTGRTIRFDQSADPSAVQIDHMVPLSVAWDMGAAEWSEDERTVFANDAARNLVASDGPANMSKSDHPPAEWLPPNRAARCEYLRRYLVVSDHYRLPITEADAVVVREQASRCGGGR